jgi:hypothetical protein
MTRAVREPDGNILAHTNSQGLIRVGTNDTTTVVMSCQAIGPNSCGGALFGGVDADGRFYFGTFEGIFLFEPGALNMRIPVTLPQQEQPIAMVTTPQLTLLATFGSQQQIYAITAGANQAAGVRTEQPLDGSASIQADRDGQIYVSNGDWLGIATVIRGDD